jgi:hypothetical protein
MKLSNLTTFFFLIFLYTSCSFFREETATTDEPLQAENIESDIRWVDILDGAEMFEDPYEDSRVLSRLHFRSKLKVSPTTKTSEGWEFVEYKSKKGWINMEDLSLEPPGSTNGFVPDYLEDICEGIQNSLECFKAVETKVLLDGAPASRDGDVLSVIIQKDKKIEFKDKPTQGDNSEYYNYIDFQSEPQIHIIQYSKYEGGHLLGVHSPSGQIIKLLDYPEISPDGKKLAAAFFCPDSNYCENGLQIYKISSKGLKEEFTLKSSKWTGSDPIWLDDSHISLFFYENGYIEEPTKKGILKHKNGKWILTKDDI